MRNNLKLIDNYILIVKNKLNILSIFLIICVIFVALVNSFIGERPISVIYVLVIMVIVFNIYSYFKFLSSYIVGLRIAYILLLMGLKYSELYLPLTICESSLSPFLCGGPDFLELDFYVLLGYILNICRGFSYFELFLLVVPGFHFIHLGVNDVICSMAVIQNGELINLSLRKPLPPPSSLILTNLAKYQAKISLERLSAVSLIGMLEPLALAEKGVIKNPFITNVGVQRNPLERFFLLLEKEPLLLDILKKNSAEPFPHILQDFSRAFFVDCQENSVENLKDTLAAIFPCKYPELIYHSLGIYGTQNVGENIARIPANIYYNRYPIAISDKPTLDSYKKCFRNEKPNAYKLSFQVGMNIFYGAKVIDEENLKISGYFPGQYDVNYERGGVREIIELKTRYTCTSPEYFRHNVERHLKDYGNQKGYLVYTVPEVTKDLKLVVDEVNSVNKSLKIKLMKNII